MLDQTVPGKQSTLPSIGPVALQVRDNLSVAELRGWALPFLEGRANDALAQ
jgi:hypothetical protein